MEKRWRDFNVEKDMASSPQEDNSRSRVSWYFTGIIIFLLGLLYFTHTGFKIFIDEAWEVIFSGNKQRIALWVEGFNWLGPLVLIIAMVAQMFLVLMPSIALIIVSVIAYGPLYGSIISFAGIFTASSIGYFLGWYLGPVVIGRLIGQKLREKGFYFISKYGFWSIFITRLSPFLYNDAISLLSGILKMDYWKFIAANLAGIAPLILLIAFLGESIDGLKTGLIGSSLLSILIFIIYILMDRRKSRKTPGEQINQIL